MDKEARNDSHAQIETTMNDLPPNLVTKILEYLLHSDSSRIKGKNILVYRLVSQQWKHIICSIIETKILYGLEYFQAFPIIDIYDDWETENGRLLYVNISPTMLSLVEENPFPFKSLYLCGDDYSPHYNPFPSSVEDIQKIELCTFSLIYGPYLTSLSIKGLGLRVDFLAKLLGNFPQVETLYLEEIYIQDDVEPGFIFPTPLPMPKLMTLKIAQDRFSNYITDKPYVENSNRLVKESNVLYMWIIVSYSDQVSNMKLYNWTPMPALKSAEHYNYLPYDSIDPKIPIFVATTSESAFKCLRKLEINYSNHTFISNSEFMNLQQLCISCRRSDFDGNFEDLISFIGNCRNTLEKLSVAVDWYHDMRCSIEKVNCYIYDDSIPLPHPPSLTVITTAKQEIPLLFPNLVRFEFDYMPTHDRNQDDILARFLQLFPNLETLSLLRFPSTQITDNHEFEKIKQQTEKPANFADIIAKEKSNLTTLFRLMYETTILHKQQYAAIDHQTEVNWEKQEFELDFEMREFKRVFLGKCDTIFKKMAKYGITKQELVIELLITRLDGWKICPRLKVISVSRSDKPNGDVLVLRRPQ